MSTMTAAAGMANPIDTAGDRYSFDTYTVHRKLFQVFGAAFTIRDPMGNVAFYSKQKAFKLKEDIRLYTDDSMQTEALTIQARHIIDFGAAYDVVDPLANQKVGAFKRKGLKSMFKDEWVIMDHEDHEIGLIKEDNTMLAMLRRAIELAALVFPQKYHLELDGQAACRLSQNFNPFIPKIALDFTLDTQSRLDKRLGIAAAVLLCAIEGKQR